LSWKVTVRHGSSVGRQRFDSLDEAIEEVRRRVGEIQREDRLPPVSMLRDFSPDEQVQARIEITGPGLFRSPEGGIDVMGDGDAIAYTGTIRKEPIEAASLEETFERLQQALGGGSKG
jgi:hypothetical protein